MKLIFKSLVLNKESPSIQTLTRSLGAGGTVKQSVSGAYQCSVILMKTLINSALLHLSVPPGIECFAKGKMYRDTRKNLFKRQN
jgi:hypothetical protein